ncbi:hypothetical protein EHE19_015370 [Ruminiclostridium herbifermentans]|uniref:DUF6431 domain-containing protein n=1 Tax=Ruminiclostridium herbifermentans TaxID=2488810 RepID=A0A4U7JJN3_9FIRM|nr:DUF6431 domain-containing protein [Ruminiclostridium herbifermentans]QNU66246.1 hypothetical protein EHE19_015370 [Ruminiclostridium herbifermentans]
MIILSNYELDPISAQLFYVRGKEYVSCPSCGYGLRVVGSRKRKYINKDGDKITLVIRRLKCSNCKRIHHELPDILIPYKRYESCNIENVLTDLKNSTVAAEESTFYRWKKWYEYLSIRILNYFVSILSRLGKKYIIFVNINLMTYLKKYPKWLSRIVTQLVNFNLW